MSESLNIKDYLIKGSQLNEQDGKVCRSTISVDIALNGGIPEGTNVLISGVPKLGKTTFSLYFACRALKHDPNKQVFFFDAEGRLRSDLLNQIEGMDLNRFNIIKSNQGKILSAEDFLNLILSTLKDYPKCICILDSIASLAPKSELESLIGDSGRMANMASLMYKVFRHTSQVLSVTKSTFIALTHLVANPNPGPGKKSFAVGGNAMKYGASVNLEGTYKEDIKVKEQIIGQLAHFKVIASALGPPGAEICLPIIYGKTVDRVWDIVNVCLELGLITKGGPWYQYSSQLINICPTLTDKKEQGQDNLISKLKSTPEIIDQIEKYLYDTVLNK